MRPVPQRSSSQSRAGRVGVIVALCAIAALMVAMVAPSNANARCIEPAVAIAPCAARDSG